ncbi:MAG: tautomerase family protein [Thermomicrobium sp.]|nr:tautomerase family protein [Thermomicrobium sp.]MCS7246524.1 tautomerase family protein [Thermomicrobium sp.]MDW7982869.1 tautomerase family protein [Thermomicrobium sp.]
MLVLKVTMLEGRTTQQKAELIRRLAEAAGRHFGVPVDEIRTIIYEVGRQDWGIGTLTAAERDAAAGTRRDA